jgi:hypothetical protein
VARETEKEIASLGGYGRIVEERWCAMNFAANRPGKTPK